MVKATVPKAKAVVRAQAFEEEREVSELLDVCENPDCGLKINHLGEHAIDPLTRKTVRINPTFERVAVRPSDMICPQCECRLVEKKK